MKEKLKYILSLLFKSYVPFGSFTASLLVLKESEVKWRSVLDIGAHKGLWAIYASKVFTDSQFVLIEPQLVLEPTLKKLCDKNRGWKYFIRALGANDAEGHLTIWEDTRGSSMLPTEEDSLQNGRQRESVAIRSIDSMIESNEINIPSLMKIDVQGYELEVLKGATKTFGHTEAFIIETSLFSFDDVPGQPTIVEIINYMDARDYVIYDFAGFIRRKYDSALGQCDIVFVKKDGVLRKSNRWSS